MMQRRWLAVALAAAALIGYSFWSREEPVLAAKRAPHERAPTPAEAPAEAPSGFERSRTAEPSQRAAANDAERWEPARDEGPRPPPMILAMFENPKPTAKEFFTAYREELCQCSDRECASNTATRYASKVTAVVWGDPAETDALISEVRACQERAWGPEYVPTNEERRLEFQAAEEAREEEEFDLKQAEAGERDNTADSPGPSDR